MLGDDKMDSNIYQDASNDKNVTVSIYQLNIDTQKSTTAYKNVTFQAILKLSQDGLYQISGFCQCLVTKLAGYTSCTICTECCRKNLP
jgi:hypothetical protein